MRRDTADDQPSLGRVLAAGSARILQQSRLSRGQAAALALSFIAAVAVGVTVQPRDGAEAPPIADAPAAAAAPPQAGAPEAEAVVRALDGLAGQIAAINDRLGDAVARERAERDRRAQPAAGRDGDPQPASERAAPPAAAPRIAAPSAQAVAPAPRARRPSPMRARQLSGHRDVAPSPHLPELRRSGGARFARHARRSRHERHRGLSTLRDFFLRGLRLPF